jgi:hypothetical protein
MTSEPEKTGGAEPEGRRASESRDVALVKSFLGHLLTGALLFIAAAVVSILIELAADYMDEFPKLFIVAAVFHVVAYLILALDVTCLVFFLVIRAYRFVRDTWNSRGQ